MQATFDFEQRIAELETRQRRAELTAQITKNLCQATDDQSILAAVAGLAEQYGVAMSIFSYVTQVDSDGSPVEMEVTAIRSGSAAIPLNALPTTTFRTEEHPYMSTLFASDDAFTVVENMLDAAYGHGQNSQVYYQKTGTLALIAMAFKANDQWTGALALSWSQPQIFPQDLLDTLESIRPILATVVANRRLLFDFEQRLAAQTAALREAQTIGGFGSVEINLLTGEVTGSDQIYEILQHDRSQPLFSMEEFIQLIHPDDRENFAQTMEAAIRGAAPLTRIEYRMILPDNQIHYMVTLAQVAADSTGRPVRLTSILQDMTERTRTALDREQLQQQVIEAQFQALQDLSAPIIPILDGIIVMPLIGGIDTRRANEITRTLLRGITDYRAKVVILDITGVPMVDSGIATHLNRTIQAARLKGVQTLVTGVSDAVAETIVDLGIDWSGMETLNTLQTGLVSALRRLGLRIERTR